MAHHPLAMRPAVLAILSTVHCALSATARCPCLTAFPAGVNPATGITIGDSSYEYPSDYGLSTCAAHDSSLPPTCDASTSLPSWCESSWCYVDRNDCNLPSTSSSYFPDHTLYYSYATVRATERDGAAASPFDSSLARTRELTIAAALGAPGTFWQPESPL